MRRSRSLELWGLGGEKAMKSRAQWQLTDAKARGMQHKTDNVQQTTYNRQRTTDSMQHATCKLTEWRACIRGSCHRLGRLFEYDWADSVECRQMTEANRKVDIAVMMGAKPVGCIVDSTTHPSRLIPLA